MKKYIRIDGDWLKQFVDNQETEVGITVDEYPPIVYDTLTREGVQVQIMRLRRGLTEAMEEISLEESDFEDEKFIYTFEIELATSKMQFDRFNELLETWGVSDIS